MDAAPPAPDHVRSGLGRRGGPAPHRPRRSGWYTQQASRGPTARDRGGTCRGPRAVAAVPDRTSARALPREHDRGIDRPRAAGPGRMPQHAGALSRPGPRRLAGAVLRGSAARLFEVGAVYLHRLGEAEASAAARARAKALPPAGVRDYYELARTHAFNRDYPEAVEDLRQALRLNKRHYWSWFQLGLCREELGEYAQAVGDFSACIALWPEFAWGHFNRGRILNQLGKKTEAHADFTNALNYDAGFGYAYFNRGLVALDMGRQREALEDFDRAAARGQDDARLHACRGIALESLGRHAEADDAFARAWQRDPDNAVLLVAFGFAVSGRSPAEADAAFTRALPPYPHNTRPPYPMRMRAT